MSESLLGKVFEPFFATKKVGEGTGLGLSQVWGFCKQVGGTATITSEVGIGTCVNLYLPRSDSLRGPQAVTGWSADGQTIQPRRLRVLVVDDDPDVLETTSQMLSVLGFDILTATSGPAGLMILQGDTRVDFVASDYCMPEMTGLDFIRQARAFRPGMPCMIMTGYTDLVNFTALASEEVAIMRKPYKMAELGLKIFSMHIQAQLVGKSAVVQ